MPLVQFVGCAASVEETPPLVPVYIVNVTETDLQVISGGGSWWNHVNVMIEPYWV